MCTYVQDISSSDTTTTKLNYISDYLPLVRLSISINLFSPFLIRFFDETHETVCLLLKTSHVPFTFYVK